MSAAQSYIVRLLRKVEEALNNQHHPLEGSMLGKVIQRLSRAEDLRVEIEKLYGVDRFEEFSLRLLWYLERGKPDIGSPVMQYEVDELAQMVLRSFNGQTIPTAPESNTPPKDLLDGFYDTLHRFGKSIDQLKRSAHRENRQSSMESDLLYRIMAEASALQEAATAIDNHDVRRFAEVVSLFIQHVLDHDLQNDVRVVNMLDNANLTVQTVLEAASEVDYDSLHQTIELLQHPQKLLD